MKNIYGLALRGNGNAGFIFRANTKRLFTTPEAAKAYAPDFILRCETEHALNQLIPGTGEIDILTYELED